MNNLTNKIIIALMAILSELVLSDIHAKGSDENDNPKPNNITMENQGQTITNPELFDKVAQAVKGIMYPMSPNSRLAEADKYKAVDVSLFSGNADDAGLCLMNDGRLMLSFRLDGKVYEHYLSEKELSELRDSVAGKDLSNH